MRWLRRWADESLRSRNLALTQELVVRGTIVRGLVAKLARERARADKYQKLYEQLREDRDAS